MENSCKLYQIFFQVILIAKLMSSGSKRTAQRKSTSNLKLIDSHSKMERTLFYWPRDVQSIWDAPWDILVSFTKATNSCQFHQLRLLLTNIFHEKNPLSDLVKQFDEFDTYLSAELHIFFYNLNIKKLIRDIITVNTVFRFSTFDLKKWSLNYLKLTNFNSNVAQISSLFY